MVDIDILRDWGNVSLAVPAWEVMFYVLVVSLNVLLGRTRSCLINTFAFTFYWTLMSVVTTSLSTSAISQSNIAIFFFCGLTLYCLIILASLKINSRNVDVA